MSTAIVLYYTRHVYPLRDTISSYLYAWKKYSHFKCLYINTAFCCPQRLLKKTTPDIIILTTSFLSTRWNKAIFNRVTNEYQPLINQCKIKVAMPQDEFLHSALLDRYLSDNNIDLILTCASEKEVSRIYPLALKKGAQMHFVLTGYIDEGTVIKVGRMMTGLSDWSNRPIDLSYRAWKPDYWLGDTGQQKANIGLKGRTAAERLGLISDISFEPKDVLNGNDWFKFLLRSKATLGCEGGASIFDPEGIIQTKVKQYLAMKPTASYEEVKMANFPDSANNFDHKNITPRHFEACVTRTLQILIEGNYKGILKPQLHYIPIKKDLSNLSEALQVLRDKYRCESVISRAYNEIVLSGKWTYRNAFRAICQIIDSIVLMKGHDKKSSHRAQIQECTYLILFNIRDWLHWRFIQIEIEAHKPNPNSQTAFIYKCLKRLVNPLSV